MCSGCDDTFILYVDRHSDGWIGYADIRTIPLCRQLCLDDAACEAFEFVRAGGATPCLIHRDKPSPIIVFEGIDLYQRKRCDTGII